MSLFIEMPLAVDERQWEAPKTWRCPECDSGPWYDEQAARDCCDDTLVIEEREAEMRGLRSRVERALAEEAHREQVRERDLAQKRARYAKDAAYAQAKRDRANRRYQEMQEEVRAEMRAAQNAAKKTPEGRERDREYSKKYRASEKGRRQVYEANKRARERKQGGAYTMRGMV